MLLRALCYLQEVFAVCKKANLHLWLEKCTFMVKEIKTLGSIFPKVTIRPNPIKIDMLLKAPAPKYRNALLAFWL